MSKKFGKTWWGEQWLLSLNNIDYSNRLPRGSAYANKGAVTKISIKENRINAKVKGSRPSPYNVDIILPPFFDPELGDFLKAIAKKPAIITKLLNRELDPEVLGLAESKGLRVFPKQWTDFKMQCSCPDWAVPCKHLAAVIYKVSAEIDNNPFLVFSLHNLDLLASLAELGLHVKTSQVEIPNLTNLYFQSTSKKRIKQDFDTEQAYQKLSFSSLTPINDALVSLLAANPAFYHGNGDFRDRYRDALTNVARNAQKIVQGKQSLAAVLKNVVEENNSISSRSKNKVFIDKDFRCKVQINKDDFAFPEFLWQISQVPYSRTIDYQPSTAALSTVFKLAIHLLANGAIVPQIIGTIDKQYAIRWLPALLNKEVRALCDSLESILPPELFYLEEKQKNREVDKDRGLNLLSLFLTEMVSIFTKANEADNFYQLFFSKASYKFDKPGEESLSGGIASWLQIYFLTQGDFKPRIVVEELAGENFGVDVMVIETRKNQLEAISLSDLMTGKEYESCRFDALKSVDKLSNFIPNLDSFINSEGQKKIILDNQAFAPFLLKMIPAIQLLDIEILLPKSLQKLIRPKVSIKLTAKKGKSFIRLDQLLDFNYQIALGDQFVDKDEFDKLLKKSDTLIKYKSGYVYVSSEELEKIHKQMVSKEEMSPFELLRAALGEEYQGAKVNLSAEVKAMIKELMEVKEVPLPKGLNAQLRPYQHRGFSWMYRNAKIGFGSVIADDMGLGKTLQVITTLVKQKEDGLLNGKKYLVVAPTGLLTNWQAEIEKFAPALQTHLYHGTSRSIPKEFDVLLTSYGIARTEAARLKKIPWHSLIVDEAQNIKNSNTAQAKAIKTIGADNFIAMSGTPVENRLSELWSIMDFSNRGLLGNVKEFQETYANAIESYNDYETAEKLKKVTAPFLMRRLKSDKTIISDLPDKLEINCFSSLVSEQAALYEKTVQEAMLEIEGVDTKNSKGLFVRQGLVLQMILALKQICNHPTQFLKNGVMDDSLSGKLTLLYEKLDVILAGSEKVLIFTQFTEMGKLMQHFIQQRYDEKPLFYHGGCSLKQRKEMVEAFQNNHADKIFILSLKAAGTGLNLTAANHVIHFDLWWNPAVEAQATDRAYRIGQKSQVMVHRFITKNTFEEKINEMIQAKKALAEMTVSTGESWIGNLSNTELKDLFQIR